jgi:cyclopropane fatty-acyl-phospholipid synthase-like methyltransferase
MPATVLAFRPGSFDAIVSFYAIFHTPRETHASLFQRMHEWLHRGGWLLMSLASDDEEGYTEEFFGVDMFWSNFGMARYRDMLTSSGFEMIDERVISHGYDAGAKPESHPLIRARKP